MLPVSARTRACARARACALARDRYLELDWPSQGRTGTIRVDDAGRPFRTSAVEGLPRDRYDTSGRAWVPYA